MSVEPGKAPGTRARRPSTVVVVTTGDPQRNRATLRDLVEHTGRKVVVAALDDDTGEAFPGLPVECIIASSLAEAVTVVARGGSDVFVVTDPVVLPHDAVARSEEILAGDLRIATVSFLSNDAGPDRFPAPRLVPFATGGAVLLSAVALALVGPLVDSPPGTSFDAVIADFSMRSRARGFVDLLDAEALVARPGAPTATTATAATTARPAMAAIDREWLSSRHPQLVEAFEREEPTPRTALDTGVHPARVKANGLRVLVDDTTLGPFETGAQITTLAIIRALAARDDVAEVGVAVHHTPHYAREVLGLPKVNPATRSGSDYASFGYYDVLHRTTQPDRHFSVAAARGAASRVVVSILDLIAYRAGSYHATADDWLEYRTAIRDSVRAADGVTTISADVARMTELERLPVARDRLFPILYGTEHLTGRELGEFPDEFAADGRIASEFLLCLGTDYTHKNRDFALGVHRELHARGRRVTLVLAGASVPFGSSRDAEQKLLTGEADVLVLQSVTSAERNWLLRHAVAVLYPTSAEGFGLVPFEAARFGTPTVNVQFGPFLETMTDLPITVASWDVDSFADAVDALLCDPVARQAQVAAILRAAARYSWEHTAEAFVAMYRALLDRPVR